MGAAPPTVDEGLPTVVLAVLVILLVLLATVIWVAFCMAVHRTARRMAEMKRQRRRQSSPSEMELGTLPTYEEAVQMPQSTLPGRSSRPPPPPHFPSSTHLESAVETLPRRHSSKSAGEKQLRIAPERPGNGSISVSVLPPSYESTQRPHSRSALVAYLGGASNPASPSASSSCTASPVYSTYDDENYQTTAV